MKEREQIGYWDLVIKGHTSLFDLKFGDLWRYRDLLLMFVKRDFISFYKQTIFGPLWFFIQPKELLLSNNNISIDHKKGLTFSFLIKN